MLLVLGAVASLVGCDGRDLDRITGVAPSPRATLASPAEFTVSTPVPYTCSGFDCRVAKPLATCSPTSCIRYFNHWVPAIQIPPGRYRIRVRIEGYTYLYRKELYGCSALTTRDGPEGRMVDGEFVYTSTLDGVFRFASGGVQWLTFRRVGDSDFASEAVFQPADESGGTLMLHRYGNSETGRDCVFSGTTDQRLIVTATPVDPPIPQPKLVLTCTSAVGENRVTRGQQITCTAATDPPAAGELKITGWSFDGKARADGDVTSTTWAGVMARGGRINVEGTIAGVSVAPAAARIVVDERVWQDPVPPAEIRKVGCSLPLTEECPLGSPLVYDRDLGQTKLYPESGLTIPYAEIATGPNTGWSFVSGDDPPIRFAALVIFLNEQLYDRRSDLYRRSNCRPSDLTTAVEAHERSHADHARRLAEKGYVNMHFESFVRFAPKERFRDELSRLAVRNLRRWLEEMVDEDHSTIGYLDTGCETRLRRNPGR